MQADTIEYTVVIDGKPAGPYLLTQLQDLNIQPGTFIRKPGMDDYKEAHEFSELRELLGFSFQQTAPQYFASFDQRLMAWTIDYFVIVLVFAVVLLMIILVMNDKGPLFFLVFWAALLIPVVKMIYGSIGDASEKQGTIGKRLLNIKVTDLMGNRISFPVSLLRNIAKIISAAPLCFGYLYSFLNKKQQCFHDLAAGTLVIKDRLI
ncbi:MAG TPA: RDD family protein [Pedobacter sp.]|nr:RDD family protein [Pedobacter sp.]